MFNFYILPKAWVPPLFPPSSWCLLFCTLEGFGFTLCISQKLAFPPSYFREMRIFCLFVCFSEGWLLFAFFPQGLKFTSFGFLRAEDYLSVFPSIESFGLCFL